MSKITSIKIQSRDKTRCNVFLDEEFAFAVSVENVYKFGLKVGQQITASQIEEFLLEDEKSVALNKALKYATSMLRTRSQVKTNLTGKGYQEKTINFVLDKLVANGIVSDVEFAKRYIESVCKTQGRKLIEYKLMAKGVKKSDIEYAFSQVFIDGEESAYYVLCKRLKNKPVTYEELSKAYRYLVGRGFSYDQVNSAINQYKIEFPSAEGDF